MDSTIHLFWNFFFLFRRMDEWRQLLWWHHSSCSSNCSPKHPWLNTCSTVNVFICQQITKTRQRQQQQKHNRKLICCLPNDGIDCCCWLFYYSFIFIYFLLVSSVLPNYLRWAAELLCNMIFFCPLNSGNCWLNKINYIECVGEKMKIIL